MRIAITHAYSWPEVRRGAERIIEELGRALADRAHVVTIISAGSTAGRRRNGRLTHVRVKRRHADIHKHEAAFGRALLPRLVAQRFDCIHSFGPQDCHAAVRTARMRRHRTVYTQLGLPRHSSWDRHPAAKAHSRVVRDVDVYGCMSRYALELLESEYGRTGALTPGGVRLSEFVPAAAREPDPTILFSADLGEPRKGGAVLVQAFGMLLRDEPRAKLWLSGQGDVAYFMDDVPAGVRDRIEWLPLGEPTEQVRRYGRAWVTTLPSKNDSFGVALIESLACGTPIAVSNHAAVPELAIPGVTGTISDPDDPASLAEGLSQAIALSQKAETVEACRTSVEKYDWDNGIAPDFERLYQGAKGDR
jgi:glycosyltransferase involved in cell wall biosynthesis